MVLRRRLKQQGKLDQKGQATTEYILLISVVVTFYMMLSTAINRMGLSKMLMAPLNSTFASAYRYGHVGAKGFDDGGPRNHPRAVGGDSNFRIFFNPEVK